MEPSRPCDSLRNQKWNPEMGTLNSSRLIASYLFCTYLEVWRGSLWPRSVERHLTNVAADKHFSDAASPQW